jgi:hypothetical protein
LLYTTEILDRSTGELVEVGTGNWITVSELGESYGVGSRRVRAILHHIGLLRPEGRHGRYRLTDTAVARGYGKRIDKAKRSKWPFDVISPAGQELIKEAWSDAVADLEATLSKSTVRAAARDALELFTQQRRAAMTTQEEVCWLSDHYPDLTNHDIAVVIGMSQQLVGRYVARQKQKRDELRRERDRQLFAPVWWQELLALTSSSNEC